MIDIDTMIEQLSDSDTDSMDIESLIEYYRQDRLNCYGSLPDKDIENIYFERFLKTLDK